VLQIGDTLELSLGEWEQDPPVSHRDRRKAIGNTPTFH